MRLKLKGVNKMAQDTEIRGTPEPEEEFEKPVNVEEQSKTEEQEKGKPRRKRRSRKEILEEEPIKISLLLPRNVVKQSIIEAIRDESIILNWFGNILQEGATTTRKRGRRKADNASP